MITIGERRELRNRTGLSIAQIIERALPVDTLFPRSHAGLLGIEENGTRDYWKIIALANVYEKAPEEVAEMFKPK